MPVQGPQPPTSGTTAHLSRSRRRHSLPALSSAQLNRLSANAAKKTPPGSKVGLPKSSPEERSKKSLNTKDKLKGNSKDQIKSPNSGEKADDCLDSHASIDENDNEWNGKDHTPSIGSDQSHDSDEISVQKGSSILQKRTQSKSNAVFIFHFEEDDDKPKGVKSPGNSTSLPPDTTEADNLKKELRNTWPQESFDNNSFNLVNSLRFNKLNFCGYKHKQFKDSRKLCHIMSPVLEMTSPVDDTEYDLEDEWSTSSGTDLWMENGSSKASSWSFQGRDDAKKRGKPIKINANSNLTLLNDPHRNNLRSALSLSPRRRNSLTTLSTTNSKSKEKTSSLPSSSQRLRSDKGGGVASTVGNIFNSLRPTTISTSKSQTLDNYEPTQLPPRLQVRRRSLSSLPDLVKIKGTAGLAKR